MHGRLAHVALSTVLLAALAPAAGAATLCVRPGGHGGCYASITEAVTAAAPYDIVRVYPGTYAESVTIDKPLSLLGTNRDSTVIDASGLPYGINVDGYDHPGLSDVTVSSFTIEHAQFEGLLVTNADDVIVRDNAVTDNDRALDSPSCPGLPPPDSQAGEGIDCGEGIHLTGVSHSAVSANIVQRNSGGILLSDDAGPTYDNLVTGNVVADNPFDCGITLASHKPAAPNGVYHNTIANNEASRNGLQGEGSGVGLFAAAPGMATYGNVVVGNTAVGNRIPGIAMHAHAPGAKLDDNVILANHLADNGADENDSATPGTTGIMIFAAGPITGTVVAQNQIEREAIAIAVKTPSAVDLHLNDFDNHRTGVANLGNGTIDATENWWGCGAGPGNPGCASADGPGITDTPALSQPVFHDERRTATRDERGRRDRHP